MKLLILGGTGFIGPKIVAEAVNRGHEVTVFNRGESDPGPMPDIERLVGDRYSDLSALKGREWDCVIDPFAYLPGTVRQSVELLAPNVGHYNMISTISIYADFSEPGMDEAAPLATVPDEDVRTITYHRDVGRHYGGLKAMCERVVDEVMGGRSCAIRSGLIVGDGDPTNRFTWWPYRARKGGHMIAPGVPGRSMQFINVYDLAAFIVTASEQSLTGAYNADAAPGTITTGQLIEQCIRITGSDAEPVWMDEAFLEAQEIKPWQNLPGWMPSQGPYAGFGQMRVDRAQQAGLVQTSLEETIAQTLAWIDRMPLELRASLEAAKDPQRGWDAGIPADREEAVLDAWRSRTN